MTTEQKINLLIFLVSFLAAVTSGGGFAFFSYRRRLMRQYMYLRHAYLGILLAAKEGRINEPDHGYSGSMFDGVAMWREDLARPLPSIKAEMSHVIDWFQSR